MDRLLNYLIVASFRNNETDKNKVKCKSNKHECFSKCQRSKNISGKRGRQ